MAANPAIVVVAYNRPGSLRRLLGSLERAEYPCRVELVISIDGGGGDEVVRVAEDFKWPAGSKDIIRRQDRMGLRSHILACGDLSERYGSVIVLEDDLYVSPVFYHFARQASEFYADRPEIGGIGLYAYRVNRSSGMLFEPLADDTDVLFLQYACSWGQVWTASQWKPFRKWYQDHQDWNSERSAVPGHVGLWPDTSWLKYHIRYLVATNRYFVYPRISLTTCFSDVGEHFAVATNHYQVALQRFQKQFRFQHIEQSCCVYDAWQTIVQDSLNRLVPELADYDYAVDFYGIKPIEDASASYILGCWNSADPIMQFGLQMRPIEMNVIERISGTEIILARKADIQRAMEPDRHACRTYSELGVRRLSRMLRAGILEKVRYRLGFRADDQ